MSETSAVAGHSAGQISRMVRERAITASTVVRDSLDRIASRNGEVNAFVEVRERGAMQAARALDERISAGYVPGRLAGVPIAVKESMWEAGIPATNGSRALVGFTPDSTLISLQRLIDEDAIVVGRTNVPEFCYRGNCENELFGRTVNPWDTTKTSGGSSGGAAAAVAAGMVPVALGSDGGGSLRIPASFCGVIGFKPTFGVVPRFPGWPGWYQLNHVGPITAHPADMALVMGIMAGHDPADPSSIPMPDSSTEWSGTSTLEGARVAYSRDFGRIRVDPVVARNFEHGLDLLAARGVQLIEHDPGIPGAIDDWYTLAAADNLASEGHLLDSGLVGADVVEFIEAGRGVTGEDYARARNRQHEYSARWEGFLGSYDFLLTPTMETVAFDAGLSQPQEIAGQPLDGVDEDWCQFVYPFNLSGHPAISVPLPVSDGTLPVGLQIVGRRFSDRPLLRFAAAVHGAFEHSAGPSPRAQTI